MLSQAEFLDSCTKVGKSKAEAPAARLFLLGLLAGFFIAIAAAATNTAAHSFSNTAVVKTICGLLFPFGLIIVIYTGAELFTGNCFSLGVSLMQGQLGALGMLRNLTIVYLGNFAASALTAAGLVFAGQMDMSSGALAVFTIRLAAGKCSLDFWKAIVLGIFCNVLVCGAVACAMLMKTPGAKAIGAYLPTCFFVICGFEHCVANMYYIPAGLFAMSLPEYASLAAKAGINTAGLSWGGFLLNNLLPVTLGNIIGGLGLAVILWYCYSGGRKKNGQ